MDINIFMAQRLSIVLQLEDSILPLLIKAYSIGAINNCKQVGPRDITVTFADLHTRNKYLQETREKRSFKYKDFLITVFPEILNHALQEKTQTQICHFKTAGNHL